jgi:hypothetical protein
MKIRLSCVYGEKIVIKEKGIYYAKADFYSLIEELGGNCGNPGQRPIVCLIKSLESEGLFWAIPMGIVGHRNEGAINRINQYMSYDESDIRSCYYHIGRTTNRSIFFISDTFPIIDEYIESEHLDINKVHYVIKNAALISELERKLFRVLAYENARPNYFRQHITTIKKYLLKIN